jgi:hypothetical protein
VNGIIGIISVQNLSYYYYCNIIVSHYVTMQNSTFIPINLDSGLNMLILLYGYMDTLCFSTLSTKKLNLSLYLFRMSCNMLPPYPSLYMFHASWGLTGAALYLTLVMKPSKPPPITIFVSEDCDVSALDVLGKTHVLTSLPSKYH